MTGFLFAFAVVTMPGLAQLNDREFLRAFQAMDAVIQNNQPVFVSVWIGSVVSLMIALVLGMWQLQGTECLLLLLAALAYLLGV